MPEKSEQINVKMTPELFEEIESAASEEGLSKSGWVRSVIRDSLDRDDPNSRVDEIESEIQSFESQYDDLDDRVDQIESLPILNRLLQ